MCNSRTASPRAAAREELAPTNVDHDNKKTAQPMATILSIGDIAIVHYDTSTDAFSFVFLRDVEAGTIVNFTDNGWLAAGGFRPGERTVTYTAPSAITAGTIVTLSGLDLDAAGDQIIAYQGDPATPTILHLVDFGDGNNTVAGDATDDNTTALPPGFTLGVNAVAVAFDQSLYAGPISGSPEGLFAALNNSANWLDERRVAGAHSSSTRGRPSISTPTIRAAPLAATTWHSSPRGGRRCRSPTLTSTSMTSMTSTFWPPRSGSSAPIPGTCSPSTARCPPVSWRGHTIRRPASSDWTVWALMPITRRRSARWCSAPLMIRAIRKFIQVSVFDGQSWSNDTTAFIHVVTGLVDAPPALDLDANNSTGFGADASATYTAGGPAVSVVDTDVLITDDGTTIQSATINILDYSLHPGDMLSIAGTLPAGITASSYNPFTGEITLSGSASLADYQTALRQVVFSNTLAAPSTADRDIQVTVNDGILEQQYRDDAHACRDPAAERRAGARPRREQLDHDRHKLSHRLYRGRRRRSPSWIPTFWSSTATVPTSPRPRSR